VALVNEGSWSHIRGTAVVAHSRAAICWAPPRSNGDCDGDDAGWLPQQRKGATDWDMAVQYNQALMYFTMIRGEVRGVWRRAGGRRGAQVVSTSGGCCSGMGASLRQRQMEMARWRVRSSRMWCCEAARRGRSVSPANDGCRCAARAGARARCGSCSGYLRVALGVGLLIAEVQRICRSKLRNGPRRSILAHPSGR
jgi:hypothetical protein